MTENKCTICGEKFEGYGNNGSPVVDSLVCNKCNFNEVIPTRILLEKGKGVYSVLKVLAKNQDTISYSQLAVNCNIPYTSIDERNNFHSVLGNISRQEVKLGKPMLSVLVHHKGDIERTPGMGFFTLADELKQRKLNETNKELQYRIIKECWKVAQK